MNRSEAWGPRARHIRWRWPYPRYKPTFKKDDAVIISRVPQDGLTAPDLVGHQGVVWEVGSPSFCVDMICLSCSGSHYMNEEELDLLESADTRLLAEKAGVEPEPVDPARAAQAELEDAIALALHAEGLGRISVRDESNLFRDPSMLAPPWQKEAQAQVGWAELPVVLESLRRVARAVDGQLQEVRLKTPHGWEPVTRDELDVTVVEMPIQLVISGVLR